MLVTSVKLLFPHLIQSRFKFKHASFIDVSTIQREVFCRDGSATTPYFFTVGYADDPDVVTSLRNVGYGYTNDTFDECMLQNNTLQGKLMCRKTL